MSTILARMQPTHWFYNRSIKTLSLLVRLVRNKHSIASELSPFERQYKTPMVETHTLPMALYGGRHTVTMLPGGGIGPELMNCVIDVFDFISAPIDFEKVEVSTQTLNKEDVDYAVTSIKRNGVAIKGNIEADNQAAELPCPNVTIRQNLDLYINMVTCQSYPYVKARHSNIDIVVIRQNTEGEYSMLEHEAVPGVVTTLKVITRSNTTRVAKYAFEYARKYGREKVTIVHKANIMKIADGEFLKTVRNVAEEYPDVGVNDVIIDNFCMQLVSDPKQYDIVVMPNLYGAITSNILCGLMGGPGLFSGKNYGDYYAVFEPGTRNLGQHIAGKNKANPVAMLNAGVDLLNHLGLTKHAEMIDNAICRTLCKNKVHTPDLGGSHTTKDVVDDIKNNLAILLRGGSDSYKLYLPDEHLTSIYMIGHTKFEPDIGSV